MRNFECQCNDSRHKTSSVQAAHAVGQSVLQRVDWAMVVYHKLCALKTVDGINLTVSLS